MDQTSIDLVQYGFLGLAVIGLVYTVRFLFNKMESRQKEFNQEQEKRCDQLELKLAVLNEKFERYQSQDRNDILTALLNNTEELKRFNEYVKTQTDGETGP